MHSVASEDNLDNIMEYILIVLTHENKYDSILKIVLTIIEIAFKTTKTNKFENFMVKFISL